MPQSWSTLVAHDIFLQLDYLKALEEAAPDTISLYYIGIFKSNELLGVAIIQRVEVYAKDVFRSYKSSLLNTFFKTGISKLLRGNVLVVGNLTHTGQHGVYFIKEKITQQQYLESLIDAVLELKTHIREKKNKRIRVLMFKDFFLDDPIHSEHKFFESFKLYNVLVQPNMIMPLNTNWTTFDDYIFDLNKKYKRRLKTARKKSDAIEHKELDLESIKKLSTQMHQLYLNVSDNAKFNTFILPEHHFYTLKLRLNENFKVYGYFLEDQLIGFYTLIHNGKVLETYFLGYDSSHQYNNQLYLNMLYDMVEYGINNKMESIVYARTAMEIKSSVGAKKVEMNMYMKHTNRIANFMFKQIFNMMNPSQKWVERHPFK